MQLAVLSWSLLGCVLSIVGPSLGAERFPSSQDIGELERDIEEIFSRRKELKNGPITRDKSVNGREASSAGNELRSGKALRATFEIAPNEIPEFGLTDGMSKNSLDRKLTKRQWAECYNISTPSCDQTSMYRTFDGSCNNLRQPLLGRARSCHQRLLPAEYDDGISKIKTYNNALPNPRNVCRELHLEPMQCDYCIGNELSVLFMGFGQFGDHDLTLTPTETSATPCCPNNPGNNESCIQIPLGNDPYFPTSCMNVTRSEKCDQCIVAQRQQRNGLTPFMDCSHIYGLTKDESDTLRSKARDGKLNATILNGEELLPQNVNATLPCGNICPCFRAGDTRVNQNLILTMLHTIFLRFHNKVAQDMRSLYPNWDHEKIFQESRKYVTACYQHIFFDEYLPIVLGNYMTWYFRLNEKYTQYDSRVDPRTINEAMAAAFRLHSTVPDYFLIQHEDKSEIIRLGRNFFNVTLICSGNLKSIAVGSLKQPQWAFDRYLVQSVTRFLYLRSNGTAPALDLCSVNIQRGRDHGLPGYTAYVKLCFGEEIKTFTDLFQSGRLHPVCVKKYESMYREVWQIDLWSALQCEKCTPGALVGPVAQCILGHQFYNTKYGDRYFYTHEGERTSLTASQKEAVLSMTLERIMCDTIPLNNISENVFLHCSASCSCNDYGKIPKMNLKLWGK